MHLFSDNRKTRKVRQHDPCSSLSVAMTPHAPRSCSIMTVYGNCAALRDINMVLKSREIQHIYLLCTNSWNYFIYIYICIYWDIFNLLDAQFYNSFYNEDSDKHFCLII